MKFAAPLAAVAIVVALAVLGVPPGTVFGLFDNGLVILGAYAGVDLESRIARAMGRDPNAILGAVLGGGVTNLGSDGAGALADPAMAGMALGICLGCLIPLLCVPVLESLRVRRQSTSTNPETV